MSIPFLTVSAPWGGSMNATSGNQIEGTGGFLHMQLCSELKGQSSFADGMNNWELHWLWVFFCNIPGSGEEELLTAS